MRGGLSNGFDAVRNVPPRTFNRRKALDYAAAGSESSESARQTIFRSICVVFLRLTKTLLMVAQQSVA